MNRILRNIIILIISILMLNSCANLRKNQESESSPVENKKREPFIPSDRHVNNSSEQDESSPQTEFQAALSSIEKINTLSKDKNYVKGFNTSMCVSKEVQKATPLILSVIYCSCVEEVKENILKENYVESSSEFLNENMVTLCQDFSISYIKNPLLIDELKKQPFPVKEFNQNDFIESEEDPLDEEEYEPVPYPDFLWDKP